MLLAALCVVIGLVVEVALHRYLVGQLDVRLAGAGERSAMAVLGPPPGGPHHAGPRPGPGPGFLDAPGQAPFTLGARLVDGSVTAAGLINPDGGRERVPAEARNVLSELPVDGHPHSRTLGELGDYRLLAARTPDGNAIVTGLPLSEVQDTVWRLALVLTAVTIAGLIAAALAGALIVRRTLRPLRRVADTAGAVATLRLDRGEVALPVRVPESDTNPRTEVGSVGLALNRMLEHVGAALSARQASETRVRQFVADASHELRTPLTAIRGYAELARRGDAPVPPDVMHAMGRIESEAARMTTLVEDLLLLARLDSGRALDTAPVDLSSITADAVSDAHVAAPDHSWRLDLPPDPLMVTGDGPRLHQVLANLLSNAGKHTPAGTTVTVTLRAEGNTVLLSVADDGPGIPAALLPEVFERFARGDSSRSRAAGSTGLGLAIVAAVVASHGGDVTVECNHGAAFTIRIPGASQPAYSGLPR